MKSFAQALFCNSDARCLSLLAGVFAGVIIYVAFILAIGETTPARLLSDIWQWYVGFIAAMGFTLSHKTLVMIAIFLMAVCIDVIRPVREWVACVHRVSKTCPTEQWAKICSSEATMIITQRRIGGYAEVFCVIFIFWYLKRMLGC